MSDRKYESIPVKKLLIRVDNPRFDPVLNQREALALIVHDQAIKLVNLGEHVLGRGTSPSDIPIVTPSDDGKLYIVLEGNRRIAALKMLTSPGLAESLGLPATLVRRWKALEAQANGSVPEEIMCVVMSPEDANEWIGLKHTGENEGVGVVGWDGRATYRFRGTSPALQAIDVVEEKGYLDSDSKKKLPKIFITNIERVLGTPEARKLLGVDVEDGHLVLTAPEEEALGRLAILVGDVLHRRIRVTQLDSKDQRVEYAQKIAGMEIPKPHGHAGGSGQSDDADKSGETTKGTTKQSVDRKTLIPKRLKLSIPQTRINQIYDELQKLDISKFTNSGAVLLRVFVELSVDDFAKRNEIPLKAVPKVKPGKTKPPSAKVPEMNLRNKILSVAKHLEDNGICGKDRLLGVRALANNRDHVLSVDSFNAYVHNQHYSPTAKDLKANWDSIQAFMEQIWA